MNTAVSRDIDRRCSGGAEGTGKGRAVSKSCGSIAGISACESILATSSSHQRRCRSSREAGRPHVRCAPGGVRFGSGSSSMPSRASALLAFCCGAECTCSCCLWLEHLRERDARDGEAKDQGAVRLCSASPAAVGTGRLYARQREVECTGTSTHRHSPVSFLTNLIFGTPPDLPSDAAGCGLDEGGRACPRRLRMARSARRRSLEMHLLPFLYHGDTAAATAGSVEEA